MGLTELSRVPGCDGQHLEGGGRGRYHLVCVFGAERLATYVEHGVTGRKIASTRCRVRAALSIGFSSRLVADCLGGLMLRIDARPGGYFAQRIRGGRGRGIARRAKSAS